MDLDVRAGVEEGTEFASQGKGFTCPHTHVKGRFVIVVNIRVPAVTNPAIVSKLRNIQREIDGIN